MARLDLPPERPPTLREVGIVANPIVVLRVETVYASDLRWSPGVDALHVRATGALSGLNLAHFTLPG